MSETDYNTLLYEKVQAEYDSFIDELKTKPVDEVVEKAYEKVMKEELVSMFYPEYEKYDISDIKALNKCEKPLEELYQGWMDFDGGIHESLEYSIDDTIETLKREQKEKNKYMER